jgi:hypothetical protein
LALDGRVKPAHGEEMNYSSRFWLYAPISTFLLLAVAAMVHWHLVDSAFEKKLAAIKGHEAIPIVVLDWDSVSVGGFPFRVDATFTNFRAGGLGAHGPFTWRTEKLALHALTYGRPQVIYEAAGRQTLSWADGAGVSHVVDFLPGSLRASSIQNAQGLTRFDLDIVDIGSQDFTIGRFTIGRFQFHMRRDPDGKDLDLMVKLDNLRLDKGPLTLKTGDLSFYATLTQAHAWNSLLRGDMSWPKAADAWRAQGGTASVTRSTSGGVHIVTPQILLSPLY